jgi:hypothetical protein
MSKQNVNKDLLSIQKPGLLCKGKTIPLKATRTILDRDTQSFFPDRMEIKKSALRERKRIFTVLAKGGAPSGHICPSSTIRFINNRMATVILIGFEYLPIIVVFIFQK